MRTNLVGAICFLAFVVSGLLITRGRCALLRQSDRAAVNVFLCVALFVSTAAGLSQHDMWPFSSWKMMTGLTPPATPTLPTLTIVGVEFSGAEQEVDYRAWKPLSPEELDSWLRHAFFRLDPIARSHIGSYLLDRANEARQEALSAGGLTYSNRWLGPLTAPTHLLHPKIWSQVEKVPPTPFVALRIYEDSWNLEERLLHARQVTRVLAFEYPSR